MTPKFFCLIVLVFATNLSWSQMLCGDALTTHILPSNKLHEILQTPLFNRIKKTSNSMKIKNQLIASVQEAEQKKTTEFGFGFLSPVEVWGEARQVGPLLEIKVVHLYLRVAGNSLEINRKPLGLNLDFVSFFYGIFSMAEYWTAQHPEITEIRFSGHEIVNSHLPALLTRFGLQPTLDNEKMVLVLEP